MPPRENFFRERLRRSRALQLRFRVVMVEDTVDEHLRLRETHTHRITCVEGFSNLTGSGVASRLAFKPHVETGPCSKRFFANLRA